MPTNFNNTTPAAGSGRTNAEWATDGNGNVSVNIPTPVGFANPMTTAGDIIVGGASGAPTRLAIGTSGQIPTVSGGTLVYQTPASSGGGLTLLNTLTASNSATLTDTTSLTSAYDEYQIHFQNIVPVTNATNFFLRVSTNGGTSYDSGANYAWSSLFYNPGGSVLRGASSGQTYIDIDGQFNTDSLSNSSTDGGFSGMFMLVNPLSNSVQKKFYGQGAFTNSSGPIPSNSNVSGTYQSTSAVNALQFFMSSGNIASGVIRIYGFAK